MKDQIPFRVRPGYKSKKLLVEFCANHHADGFPSVHEILREALQAELQTHPDPGMQEFIRHQGLLNNFISYWVYAGGAYEIDDDNWGGLFVLPQENHSRVASDVEQALLRTGLFVKEEVNLADYA